MLTILCVATYFKGDAFLREAKQQGCTVLLLTSDKLANDAWPREAIDEIHSIPRDADEARIKRTVDAVARRHRIERITALDDFDVEMGAMLREHLQVPGMGRTTASRFRDKLAMRMKARNLGIPVPEFAPVFTDQDVNDWLARVAPPWMLKPRSSAAAIGIKKVNSHDELWRALHAAGDQRSRCVLEQFVPGDVYHVDSIVWDGGVIFAVAFKYGRPPMQIAHEGGIFITRRLADGSAEGSALLALNQRLQDGLGLRRGVSHTEFIRQDTGGVPLEPGREFVFLETSARVGGAFIVDTIEAGTGINLWREWAKIEVAGEDGTYSVPPHRDDHSGIVLSLARQELPDMSAYVDPEITTRIRKHHHAGLIVASPDPQRVEALMADYTERFYRDFFATAPPPERPVE
ncbi:MAG: ATPase [Acidobacteria bacterium 13_1_20CM_2_65_9]|nr:MAG: ATPase [Acidobacteria bacterium 13_1_20CM_2_65_9]